MPMAGTGLALMHGAVESSPCRPSRLPVVAAEGLQARREAHPKGGGRGRDAEGVDPASSKGSTLTAVP